MSSPAPPSAEPTKRIKEENEVDIDADMEDVNQEDNTAQNTSSGTLDNDFSTTQQATDTQHTSSSLLHQNRKDVSLREFLSKMDDYAPIIPDAVTAHYLTLAGLPPPSPHDPSGASTNTTPLPLARLLALATQKFVADIAADAYQYSRIRASNTASGSNPLGATGMIPGQAVAGAAGGAGGAGGGGGKGSQATQLGVQRAGYGGGGQGGSAQGRTVLTMEDLGMAVQEYGINVKRGEFYRDSYIEELHIVEFHVRRHDWASFPQQTTLDNQSFGQLITQKESAIVQNPSAFIAKYSAEPFNNTKL